MIYDAAVIIPTVLRPMLGRAVRSVFAQDFKGSVQILVGIDVALGPRQILDELRAECPERMTVNVLDLGYSTSARNGGFYKVWAGGSLRTMLSYAANSRYLAYLDDDNWWAPSHLSDLRRAIEGFDWAFSLRWFVDPFTQEPLCIDEWESVGPGKGILKERDGGFVDTSCLMINKLRCHWMLPAWCVPRDARGSGVDKRVFKELRAKHSVAWTGKATAFYVYRKFDDPTIRKRVERRTDFSSPSEYLSSPDRVLSKNQ